MLKGIMDHRYNIDEIESKPANMISGWRSMLR